MCIAVFLWEAHPLYPFILLLNRDEFHSRETKKVGWWGEGECQVLGGRDEVGGGTWLGCNRRGKIAFLTNVRQKPSDQIPTRRSRGHLPLRFLQGNLTPEEFAAEVAKEAAEYNGFNLVLVDVCSRSMVYVTNGGMSASGGGDYLVAEVPRGMHVLSNASLDTPWPKAQRLRECFGEYMFRNSEARELRSNEMAETVMTNSIRDEDASLLPGILSPEWEIPSSSVFVDFHTPLGRYGTRSTSILSVNTSGRVEFYERHLVDESDRWEEHTALAFGGSTFIPLAYEDLRQLFGALKLHKFISNLVVSGMQEFAYLFDIKMM